MNLNRKKKCLRFLQPWRLRINRIKSKCKKYEAIGILSNPVEAAASASGSVKEVAVSEPDRDREGARNRDRGI